MMSCVTIARAATEMRKRLFTATRHDPANAQDLPKRDFAKAVSTAFDATVLDDIRVGFPLNMTGSFWRSGAFAALAKPRFKTPRGKK